MITEETIKQTKFYMGDDGRCYLVRGVRTVKLVSLICTRDGTESDLLLGDGTESTILLGADLCSSLTPTEAAFKPFIENQVAAARPVTKPAAAKKTVRGPYNKRAVKAKAKAKTKRIAGQRGPRDQFSQYKGVTRGKTKKDGTITYRANAWNGKINILLGTYDSELQAAAAVADFKGDKAKAARLRSLVKQDRADMAEQLENNQDRPRKKMAFKCKNKGCKLKWQSKPDSCPGCSGTSFEVIWQ